MSLTRRFVLAAMALLLAAPAWAARPVQLSAQDLADVQRVEDYLNGITTLQARFLQASPNGATAEGTAYISRPGKMRLAYDPPSPILVVADGRMLVYYDSELKETSYAPLDST
ncbi:MAG: outer membrane lipoprotein carrier protein LolA, partial [Rhodospirillales bacterium]|nr:outer membrane lipoprotein carrier protein LolA [Rhodospirillales bacterium]